MDLALLPRIVPAARRALAAAASTPPDLRPGFADARNIIAASWAGSIWELLAPDFVDVAFFGAFPPDLGPAFFPARAGCHFIGLGRKRKPAGARLPFIAAWIIAASLAALVVAGAAAAAGAAVVNALNDRAFGALDLGLAFPDDAAGAGTGWACTGRFVVRGTNGIAANAYGVA